jgi:hypothetical protein
LEHLEERARQPQGTTKRDAEKIIQVRPPKNNRQSKR